MVLVSYGCTGSTLLVPRPDAAGGVAWFGPPARHDVASLERWRQGVGLPYVAEQAPASRTEVSRLIVVSWNTAVGDADVVRFVRNVRSASGEGTPIVLLLQEAFRTGLPLHPEPRDDASYAGRLGRAAGQPPRDDIASIARECGLNVYYAPSMRNGPPSSSSEDRGNAILSSLPLRDLSAIELPFEAQRRVALAATIDGSATDGRGWSLRVVSVHLDNVAGWKRLWLVASQVARTRQAKAVVTHLRGEPNVVLAGDFNSWYGFQDPAYRAAADAFAAETPVDRRRTFRGIMRLDHMFFRLPPGWTASFRRAEERYGSDHYPLVATIEIS
jgi:endonuclease/exonuclease/phosphatase family metal-dependent hydrolase